MKNRELDRLGHFVLKQLSINFVKQSRLKEEIEANKEVKNKDKRELYKEIIEAGIESQTIVARVMSAAENSSTFRFSRKDANTLTVQDVAGKLGIKLKKCCDKKKKDSGDDIAEKIESASKKIAEELGVEFDSIKAVADTPEVASEMKEMLEKLVKNQGKK